MVRENETQIKQSGRDQADHLYVVTRMEDRVVSFLFDGNRPVEIHVDQAETEKGQIALGNVYIGRIQNIVKNIGAAFVEIAPGQVCYLPLDDMKSPVYTKKGSSDKPQQGDELLVQIVREGIKTKAPAVSTNLTLHGKYALLTTGNRRNSVSSKINKEEKARLLKLLEAYEEADNREKDEKAEYGWLLRTNAAGIDRELLAGDLDRLKSRYEELMKKVQFRTVYSCLISQVPQWLKRLSDIYSDEAERILTDDAELSSQMKEYFRENQPEDLDRLVKYDDKLQPLYKLYSLEHHLKEALQERVWLKSGGYLVIQPTEALTVVDVNTGKFEGGKQREAAFLKINKEAAAETARQLRLRNLSGIIIVDFINMEKKESDQELMQFLDQELRKDPVRTVLVDMTKLSLVEITRMKRERPLHESWKERTN